MSARIAILHPSLEYPRGAERIVAGLARGLARRGHDVTILTSRYASDLHGNPDSNGYAVIEFGGPGWDPSGLVEQLRVGRQIAPLLKGYDLINVHGYPAVSWLYFARTRVRALPPIVWLCNEPSRALYDREFNTHSPGLMNGAADVNGRHETGRWLELSRESLRHPGKLLPPSVAQSILRTIDRHQVRIVETIVCNSAFAAERIGLIYPWADVRVCHLGTRPLRAEPSAPPERDDGRRTILTVSPLYRIKNVDIVLRAVKLLVDRGRFANSKYVLVGVGPEQERLSQLTTELGIQHSVELRGFVPVDELGTLYQDAAVIAYLPLDEPFGLVFLEAMITGKPVVGPNHGGPTEIVVDRESGLLVDPTDAEAVANALDYLLSNPDCAREIGRRGHERFSRLFTLDAFVNRFEEHLRLS